MKTRSDFVSNSSSCSFIIHLQTERDVADFKKMLDKFGLSIDNIRLYSGTSLADVMRDTNVSLKSYDELKSGTYVETIVSDNDTQADVGRLNQIREHLQNGDTFYEVFEDPNAHVTFGKDYPLQTT